MTVRSGYPLHQVLPPEVLVGGNAVWSRYRQYPVFSVRWLLGRSLLFCSVLAIVGALTGTGMYMMLQEPLIALKELIMAKTPDFTQSVTDAVADMQTKAKAAYEKGTAFAGEATEFAKGNVEAMVESGKIFSEGLQSIGKTYVDEAKSAYETATADFKEMAAIKSPTELFQLQGKLARRNFDAMMAFGSKSSEAFVKLANEGFAPISSRVSLAADKMSKAA